MPIIPTVEYTPSLRRHVTCPAQQTAAGSLREVLEAALKAAPGLARYVFGDPRVVRKPAAVFVNADLVYERGRLDRAVAEGDRVLVQALAGC